jgi:hypothetical protein
MMGGPSFLKRHVAHWTTYTSGTGERPPNLIVGAWSGSALIPVSRLADSFQHVAQWYWNHDRGQNSFLKPTWIQVSQDLLSLTFF